MTYSPYDTVGEVYSDWCYDPDKPTLKNGYARSICPLCGESIVLHTGGSEEIYADGSHSFCDCYHKECAESALSVFNVLNFLDEKEELASFFDNLYGCRISELSFSLKETLIGDFLSRKNRREAKRYVEVNYMSEFLRWYIEKIKSQNKEKQSEQGQ